MGPKQDDGALGMIAVGPGDFHATQLYILADTILCSLSMEQEEALFLTYRQRFFSALYVWGCESCMVSEVCKVCKRLGGTRYNGTLDT